MDYRWIPIIGEFSHDGEDIIFKGKEREMLPEPGGESLARTVASVGIYVSNRLTGDGVISGDVTFADITPDSVCEFLLAYDVESKKQLTAGLGGGWSMFAIRSWLPSPGPGEAARWDTLDAGGDRANLVPGKTYHVEVQLFGSRVRLAVDGVDVASAQLREPLPPKSQVGLFCLSYSDVRVAHFKAETEKAKAFIVMQFSSPFNEIYSDCIKKACEDHGLEPVRADELYGPGMIIQDISDQIVRSQVVIADITPANPNVYFEVGYAHALKKPAILLAEKGTKLPFDLSGFRALFYENTIAGRRFFEDGLRKHLTAIMGAGSSRGAIQR